MFKNSRLTEELARAAATDAGNRSMRAAGRKVWSAEDYVAAVEEYDRLWPNTAVESASPSSANDG